MKDNFGRSVTEVSAAINNPSCITCNRSVDFPYSVCNWKCSAELIDCAYDCGRSGVKT